MVGDVPGMLPGRLCPVDAFVSGRLCGRLRARRRCTSRGRVLWCGVLLPWGRRAGPLVKIGGAEFEARALLGRCDPDPPVRARGGGFRGGRFRQVFAVAHE